MTLMNTDMVARMKRNTLRAVRAETVYMTLAATELTQEAYEETVRWVETFPLTHFFTLTFARPTSDKVAVKRLLQWQDALERVNRSAVGMLFGLEEEPGLHAHGVLIGNPGVLAAEAEHLWRRMAGAPKVRPYDRSLNSGAAYALKEAFWTQAWDFEHLEFYSPEVRMRRARRTREFFFQSLALPVPSAS